MTHAARYPYPMTASDSSSGVDGTLHRPQRPLAPPPRLVLDTNVWLDWLVFGDPEVAPVRSAVAAGQVEVCIDEAVEAELMRVLGYPFGIRTLSAEAQQACLAECRRIARRDGTATNAWHQPLPRCEDPDDQKFLDLAAACGARYLVTRDRDLLELARHRDPVPPFRIVTPRELRALLAAKDEG
jgi:putative PIN family toxin of toxin-antitoxin system